MNHVVIWNADRSSAQKLVEGVKMNQHALMPIVCADHQECKKGNSPYYLMPSDPASESMWEETLGAIFVDISRQRKSGAKKDNSRQFDPITGADEGTKKDNLIILHFVVSAANCEHARDQLCALLKGANSISRMNFRVDIIMLLETSTAYAAQQQRFLQSLQQDVEKQSNPCLWHRLTMLSDWDDTGDADPMFARARVDLLCGVICEATPPEGCYECLTYKVRQSSFSRKDVQSLPKQMLYDVICQHKETGDKTDFTSTLVLDSVADLVKQKIAKQHVIPALLADDDNYEDRTGDKLLQVFIDLNGRAFVPHEEIQQLADQWLLDAQKQLACWIDVDSNVRQSIEPKSYLEAELNRKRDNLTTQSFHCDKKLHFGHKVHIKARRKATSQLAELFIQRVTQRAQEEYLEAIEARLPQLRAYLALMDAENLRYFSPRTDLKEAFKDDDWSKTISQILERFDMDRLSMDDDMVDKYPEWLKTTLDMLFFDHLPKDQVNGLQAAEEAFITKAKQNAEKDPAPFVMLDKCFKQVQDESPLEQMAFLGASSRLYLLEPKHWDIKSSDITSTFIAKSKSVADAVDQNSNPLAPQENHGTEVNMTIQLEQKGSICILSWHWPMNTSTLDLTITNTTGKIEEYSQRVHRPKREDKSELQLPPHRVRFGDTVCIRLEAPGKMYSQKKFLISRVEQPAKLQPAPYRFTLWPSLMKRHYVDIARQPEHNTDHNRYILELHQDRYVFKYPIPTDKEQMIVLCPVNREWQSMQLVLEGN